MTCALFMFFRPTASGLFGCLAELGELGASCSSWVIDCPGMSRLGQHYPKNGGAGEPISAPMEFSEVIVWGKRSTGQSCLFFHFPCWLCCCCPLNDPFEKAHSARNGGMVSGERNSRSSQS